MDKIRSGSNPAVFISYSRNDALEFVEQLLAGLEVGGFQPIIDRHDISGGEDWRKRIGGLIADADFVVFVITPNAVGSEICEWEIEKTARLGKRLLPVVPAEIDTGLIPGKLQSLNFIFFYSNPAVPGSGFGRGLLDLCKALRTDLDWVRSHTRYGQRATEWIGGDRAVNRLLSGDDVDMAKEWIAKRRTNAPEITDDMREFILASETAENERRNAEARRLQEREDTLARMEKVKEQALGYLELAGLAGNQMLKRMQAGDLTARQKRSMVELCQDATKTTQLISTTGSGPKLDEAIEHFWYLYWGPLYIVETYHKAQISNESPIETNMVEFGKVLNEIKELEKAGASIVAKKAELLPRAAAVAESCREFEAFVNRGSSETA